jgi:hypothetical protein
MVHDSKASQISNLVNSTIFNPLQTGVELSTDHRYLVNEEFKMFLHFVGQLSRNYDKGHYDDRNQFACKCAKTIVDALKDADLYDRKFWEDEYDKTLEKCFK